MSVYQPKSADFVGAVGVYEADLAVYETPKGTRAWRRAWKLYSRPFCDLHFSYTSGPCSQVAQGAACAAPGLGCSRRACWGWGGGTSVSARVFLLHANASPARHAPCRRVAPRRAAEGRARGVRLTRSESVIRRVTPRLSSPAARRYGSSAAGSTAARRGSISADRARDTPGQRDNKTRGIQKRASLFGGGEKGNWCPQIDCWIALRLSLNYP